ncbi:MAG: zf-TFIIB domain-containing protein [Planctomycetota bacterium]
MKRLFGDHCARCGETRTKTEYEGLPTCEKCELELQADRERKRSCPVCVVEMEKTIVQKIIVDKCPACQGAWLDSGELDLLKKAVEADGSDFATGMIVGMAVG